MYDKNFEIDSVKGARQVDRINILRHAHKNIGGNFEYAE